MWVELTIPVPPGLAELCGYPGDARYVGLCWQPCGDECEYDDGRLSGTGCWEAYRAYTRHPAVAPALSPFHLGSSDLAPAHLLILDRAERRAFVADVRAGRDFLRRQDHAPPREIDLGDAAGTLADLLDVTAWEEVPVDRAAVEARMLEAARQTEEMLRFLDGFTDARGREEGP